MKRPRTRYPSRSLFMLLSIPAAGILVHLLINGHYGWHLDELAMLDDARNLEIRDVHPVHLFLGLE
jgi:hypothetical protein